MASALGKLEPAINPALAVMLFTTFLQVPLPDLGKAFREFGFMAIPLAVALLVQLLPPDPLLRLLGEAGRGLADKIVKASIQCRSAIGRPFIRPQLHQCQIVPEGTFDLGGSYGSTSDNGGSTA
jgi:hypothetical protein